MNRLVEVLVTFLNIPREEALRIFQRIDQSGKVQSQGSLLTGAAVFSIAFQTYVLHHVSAAFTAVARPSVPGLLASAPHACGSARLLWL